MNRDMIIKTVIIILLAIILLLASAVLSMTEKQLEDEGRMADKYGDRK